MNLKNGRLSLLPATVVAFAVLITATVLAAEKAAPLNTFARLPIKEITVFKDGNAFVAHEGDMPVDKSGNVVMDYLPAPVLGTFWPYATDPGARLTAVTAGQKRVLIERTALTLRELLQANVDARVLVSEGGTNQYEATILGLPARSAEELASTSPPNAPERLPELGGLVLLQTETGVKAVAIDRIQELTFRDKPRPTTALEEFRNLLTLKLDWGKNKPAGSARVGLFYLQKGVRWIPNYKIDIDGNGKAVVKLQATLINELADLEDISVNLVVGVPSFAFKDNLDPIALQQNLAALSQFFQTDANNRNGPLAYQFSNAIMSQSARPSEYRPYPSNPDAGGSLGPEIADAGKTEDLFVFNVQHVTLKRGERMVLPVTEFSLEYKDVFTLDLPFGPPPEVRANLNTEQQRELARLFNAPKVNHKLRLANNSKYPLTTAPALFVREGKVLGQGLMTYTAPGGNVDLAVTTAVDVQAKKTDRETKRTPNAIEENGVTYSRIDLSGKISLVNHRSKPIELEVTRYVLGTIDRADRDAKIEKLNRFEDGEYLATTDLPIWWSWYNWPAGWSSLNGIGQANWKFTVEPEKNIELNYDWHYFWR
ncbi:MAG TPA: hypothetical protein VL361_27615 [Candidatus Limnocylindrales bacterium]|nr:hypothetical protein [Candidatus Limnocylindrales bacterium]